MKILVLNAGSSSQKSAFYDLAERQSDQPLQPLWEAKIDWTHREGMAEIDVKTSRGKTHREELSARDRESAIAAMFNTLTSGETQVLEDLSEIEAVGHRVVHGGQEYRESVVITPEVKAAIARLSTFAPAHNPANLEGIAAIEHRLGTVVPQVAVFDTAFHAQLPLPSAVYPIPYKWFEQGIRKYGFHGISHEYCANRAAHLLNRALTELKLITCHLGNGCSLAAIQNGRSIDTTMGFTPLDGLMMGSRSGSIDPGILIHLMREEQYSVDDLDHLLNKNSGLKGVSGLSSDMRQIQAAIANENSSEAALAFEIYIHRLQAGIGAMMATLRGIDTLVFTAGVGENNAEVRSRTCEAFRFLGLKIDAEINENHPINQDIATPDSTVRVLVIHTEEDWAIAQETQRICTV
ncbi:acetate kinase [Myxacorys almedinensis]|uniref:Acetate kinase n=1 Tax=Myxacorys almedinensis A TaxID=2690445 RepID=A0A8J7Z2R8_9CYAN|nr:acetate kinase [Myxacorys almedinensis]NDJ18967.1 acetate/propionate family kinase [Myxacorys almedinensis A]